MTQKTKLEILGPYTPEHEGPFCTRDGRAVRIICTDRKSSNGNPIVALLDDGAQENNRAFDSQGKYCLNDPDFDLMNAREVPVAREFWVNEYEGLGFVSSQLWTSLEEAQAWANDPKLIRTIHVREVLPGEGA